MQRDHIDPESLVPLAELLAVYPGGTNTITDLDERRRVNARLVADYLAMARPHPRVRTEERMIPGPAGAPEVRIRVYHPAEFTPSRPAILFIHGGGMVLGDLDNDHQAAITLCDAIGALVVSVDYRLAPEHPYPAAPEDCYAALHWMAGNAEELGVSTSRLAVYGASAGGGLAVAVCLMARDRRGPRVHFLMAIYPMLDDRNETASSQEILDVGVWDRTANLEAWAWYLDGHAPDGYAAPARAENLHGLPPTFIDVGTVDLFRDEDITFAERLMQTGVPCELHVYPGAYHASEKFAPDAELSRRIVTTRLAALRRALH